MGWFGCFFLVCETQNLQIWNASVWESDTGVLLTWKNSQESERSLKHPGLSANVDCDFITMSFQRETAHAVTGMRASSDHYQPVLTDTNFWSKNYCMHDNLFSNYLYSCCSTCNPVYCRMFGQSEVISIVTFADQCIGNKYWSENVCISSTILQLLFVRFHYLQYTASLDHVFAKLKNIHNHNTSEQNTQYC